MRHIACPVALHPDGGLRRIAMCLHPENGPQLLQTSVGDPTQASGTAARVLFARSALETRAALLIGTSTDINPDEIWHFALCRIVPPVREQWQHLDPTSGALLRFSWTTLDAPPNDLSAPDARALDWIRTTL